MFAALATLAHDETGEALVEYGLLLAGISLVALLSIHSFGESVSALFNPAPSPIVAGPKL